jgi:hypothetical protein
VVRAEIERPRDPDVVLWMLVLEENGRSYAIGQGRKFVEGHRTLRRLAAAHHVLARRDHPFAVSALTATLGSSTVATNAAIKQFTWAMAFPPNQ